mgnify:CR=1 FL=1
MKTLSDLIGGIKARQAEMDADDAQELRLFNANERKRKQKEEELNELAIKSGNKPFNLGCGDCRKQILHQKPEV